MDEGTTSYIIFISNSFINSIYRKTYTHKRS